MKINRLILVAGNIGAGKTSLTERLGARLGWRTSFESVADNPYLPDFYGDWLQPFDLCPVLTIPSEHLDFVNRPDHLDIVIDRIRTRLAGKEAVVFPNHCPEKRHLIARGEAFFSSGGGLSTMKN